MRLPRFVDELNTEPVFPGNGLPPRPGEDRPGLSPFGRLAMGGTLGKSSILIYDRHEEGVQDAGVNMINIEGDDLEELALRLDKQNVTGEQTNAEVTPCDFPGDDEPIRWPPLEALVEFGTGGVGTKIAVDYINGVTLSVSASFLRVSALVTQGRHDGDIFGTSAAYYLAAHVGPGFAECHAQRTVFVGEVDNKDESGVFELPRLAKIATLVGRRHHHERHAPAHTAGWIRFWQSPNGRHGVGDVFVANPQLPVQVPNGAMYFTVFNESGHEMNMSVIFGLGL